MTAPESRRGNEYFRETERIAAAARIRELEDALAETARDRDEGWRQHNLEVIRRIESLEASARAAGSATDALKAIAGSDISCAQEDGTEDGVDCATAYAEGELDGAMPEDWCPQCYFVFVARSALAVLGHATPAADEERQA